MKKAVSIIVALIIALSVFPSSFAAEAPSAEEVMAQAESLKDQKTELSGQISALQAQLNELNQKYTLQVAAGDVSAAEDTLAQIGTLQVQLDGLTIQMREQILARRALLRSLYSSDFLARYDDTGIKIAGLVPGANILSVGCVDLDGELVVFDTPPYITGQRTLVPVRALSELLGCTVTWYQEDKAVTIIKGSTAIVLYIGSKTVLVNGEPVVIDAAASLVNGRTYVPLRFVSEQFGLTVSWDSEDETIGLTGEVSGGGGTSGGSGGDEVVHQ